MSNLFQRYTLAPEIAGIAMKIYEHVRNGSKRVTWKRELFHGFCISKACEVLGIFKSVQEICLIVNFPEVCRMDDFIRSKSRASVSGVYTKPIRVTVLDCVRTQCTTLGVMNLLPMIQEFLSGLEDAWTGDRENPQLVSIGVIASFYYHYVGLNVVSQLSNALRVREETVMRYTLEVNSVVQGLRTEPPKLAFEPQSAPVTSVR